MMSDIEVSRTRIVRWEDPTPALRVSRMLSGLAYLKAIQEGELPPSPIGALMGIWMSEVDEGRVVFAAEPGECHYNPLGTVHGGLAATLLDSAFGCAVLSMLPVGSTFTTLELKVNYLRPMTAETGRVYAEGKVVHLGARIATAEGRLTDAGGKLYAHGTTTCMILRPASLEGRQAKEL